MKKNYIQPITNVHNISIRPIMAGGSITGDTVDLSGSEDGDGDDQLGHSIWDDTCGDGFNW